MTESEKKYLEEYEKHKHIKITPGKYILKDNGQEVVIEDVEKEKAVIYNPHNNHRKTKTVHWCRKRLEKCK